MMLQEMFTLSGNALTVSERLAELRESLDEDHARIDRVAIAVYDRNTGLVRTFAHSTAGAAALWHYEVPLDEVPSLKHLAGARCGRFIEDLSVLASSASAHSTYLMEQGFTASYTQPVFAGDELIGFVFLNSLHPRGFAVNALPYLALVTRIASLMLSSEVEQVRMLVQSLETTREIASLRDRETGEHLERIGATSRRLCKSVADEMQIDDELCELIYQFAPLHDVGKIAIPDSVLSKTSALSREEIELMRTHTVRGAVMIDRFSTISNASHLVRPIRVLRNIVLHHHEAWDGSGYPHALSGNAIPVEARIVAVVDAYDALTNQRHYKEPWKHETALQWLLTESGRKFDPVIIAGFARIADEIRDLSLAIGLDPE